MNDNKSYAVLAKRVLESDTPYSRGKATIHNLFDIPNNQLDFNTVVEQLTVIDSYYSTNMSRRYYGIQEIAEKICKITDNKNELKNRFIDYTKTIKDSEINDLFSSTYGYRKNGKKFGQAISLISKYAYFITDFNFPIYDSIVREVYPILYINKSIKSTTIQSFISAMNDLLSFAGIDNYNDLDNLMWLIGKINRGSFSLVLNKEVYLCLLDKIKSKKNIDNKSVDKAIFDFIMSDIDLLQNILTQDQLEMINVCKTLNNRVNLANRMASEGFGTIVPNGEKPEYIEEYLSEDEYKKMKKRRANRD